MLLHLGVFQNAAGLKSRDVFLQVQNGSSEKKKMICTAKNRQ